MSKIAVLFSKRKKRKNAVHQPSLSELFPDAPTRHLETIEHVSEYTMTSPERILALCQAVDYVNQNSIPGAIVECGVWRGGSMAAVARTLQQAISSEATRDLWLYDTFSGMSEPTENDVDLSGQTAEELMSTQDKNDPKSVWCLSPIEEVRNVIQGTGYPDERVFFVPGKVEDTLPKNRPGTISLLRLDTDWYESTRCELEYLFPLLSPGGVLIIDDYGHWKGCRRAVDEYFSKHGISMLLNRIDYTGRIGIYSPMHSGLEKTHAA